MTVFAFSRQAGSYGDELAHRLSNKEGIELIDFPKMMKKFIEPVFKTEVPRFLDVSPKYFLEQTPDQITYKEYLDGALRELADRESAVILGFGAQHFLAGHPRTIFVRVIADEKDRAERVLRARNYWLDNVQTESNTEAFIDETREIREICDDLSISELKQLNATELLERIERKHRRFVSTVFGKDDAEILDYHLIINTSKTSLDAAIGMLRSIKHEFELQQRIEEQQNAKEMARMQLSNIPEFKNESEEEFARILNMYQMEWRYEPKFFPVEWDDQGRVTLAFSPDFYLPRFDLYLELTTMNQKYVRMKKKKLRKMKELYPGVNVKIVYRRDFISLLERFDS